MNIVVMTIAGSDPSGGAGIQSDLRTLASVGVIGISAITALTIQNSVGVAAIFPISAEIVANQIRCLLEDIPIHAVKIGMLCSSEQIEMVAEVLQDLVRCPIILDPIISSTDGKQFLDIKGISALREVLLPLVNIVTPNLSELDQLTNRTAASENERIEAAMSLLGHKLESVLIKGGHLTGDKATDILVRPKTIVHRTSRMIGTVHTHGTGCMLSTALAAFIAKGYDISESLTQAKNVLDCALTNPVILGRGRGYPNLKMTIPFEYSLPASRLMAPRISGIYAITDCTLRPERSHLEIVEAAMQGGAKVIQIRDKNASTRTLIETTRKVLSLARKYGAIVVINDRVDIALACGADGVHLGPDDMPPSEARKLLGPEQIIGVSIATSDEAIRYADVASYFGIGAIYGSTTKFDAGKPIGLERVIEIKTLFPSIPIVAIGGISESTIADVARSGAQAAAVISAIICANDMVHATRSLVSIFENAARHQDTHDASTGCKDSKDVRS